MTGLNRTVEPALWSVPALDEITWSFNLGDGARHWDWTHWAPNPKLLAPARTPASGALSRHVPVQAWCETTDSRIHLESMLELELLSGLDRDRSIVWLVAQPFRLSWPAGRKKRTHVPDLLAVDEDGRVEVWNAKAAGKASNSRFVETSAITEQACASVGWDYQVFTGYPEPYNHNLAWLAAYRRPPLCLAAHRRDLLAQAERATTLGQLATNWHSLSCAWHLIWSGDLTVDLTKRLTWATAVIA